MNAMILSLSPEVREAALDLKALRRKIKEAGQRAYEWVPAEANARQRMLCLSLEQAVDQEALSSLNHIWFQWPAAALLLIAFLRAASPSRRS